jgi:beta-N-acetylhexosaminidase
MGERAKAQGEMTELGWRKKRAGQRLLLGVGGPALTMEERRLFRALQPAGFILFARNVVEPAQVKELHRELEDLLDRGTPPLLSVDQEGGRVLRVRNTPWPSMRTVGRVDDLATTRRVGRAMGDELRAMGFNLNFAPVADVDSNPKNPIIGDRSFSPRPERVAAHAGAYLQGLTEAGVLGCAKHFPGHGDTTVDSHKDLPVVDKDRGDVRQIELVPFQALVRAGVGMVMTSHVMFPAFDEEHPATMSRPVLHGLLREDLGFQGVVISDDLEMKAVRGRWPLPRVLDLACRATVDLFCIGRSFEPGLDHVVEAYEALVQLQEDERRHDRLAERSGARLKALRERGLLGRAPAPPLSCVGSADHRALAAWLLAEGGDGAQA